MLKLILQRPLALLLAGGLATALILVFPILGILQWISMVPIFLGVYALLDRERISAKRAYLYGFLTVYAYYFVLYHWFVKLYPLDFAGLEPGAAAGVVAIAWLGMPLLQAIPGGLIFVFYRLIGKTDAFKRFSILRPFAFSALWVIFEWSSTLHWTGVPWGRLALGQIEMLPMLQSASLFGSYFVSFLILTVNGLLAYSLVFAEKKRLCALAACGVLVANFAFGVVAQSIPAKEENTLRAAVLQPNVGSQEKWGDSEELTMERCEEFTRKAAEEGAELLILPETVFPFELGYDDYLIDFFADLATEYDVYFLIGAFYTDKRGDEYNGLYLMTPDGELSETIYGKRHLVPFGEYVPMREFVETVFPPLSDIAMLDSDLAAGKDSSLFETEWGRVGSLICFDSIYEQLTLDSVRDGADLMVISSNDSWFFDSAAVYQHQAQAQLRAIESGRYILRSANTGISTIISPKGELLAWIDPLVDGYAVSDVATISQNTLYTVVGNLFVYLSMIFCAGLLGAGLVLKRKEKNV